ncbi:MAG: WD40/YVTN/BNR-like repeat-containing protein [bacterium]
MPILIAVLNYRVLVARHGQHWHLACSLDGHRFTCAASDPHRSGAAYVGTNGGGLWRTEDGGLSWHEVGAGPGSGFITALAVDRHERGPAGGIVYAGTEPSRFYRSADGGGSWVEPADLTALPSSNDWSFPPRPHTHHVRWIEADPAVAGRIFVAIEAGALIHTLDGGRTWQDRVSDGPFDTHTMTSHPAAPGRFYSAAGDGYYETADGGATWASPEQGLRHTYLVTIAVDPGDPSTVVVSGSSGPWTAYNPSSADAHVYRRSGDARWKRVTEGLPASDGTVVSHFAPGGRLGLIYAANNRGVFMSTDAGARWSALDVAWDRRYESEGVQALLALDV